MLNVLDYFNCVMHNSPAADDFIMCCFKIVDYFNWVMHNSPAADDFSMWSVKSSGLYQVFDA